MQRAVGWEPIKRVIGCVGFMLVFTCLPPPGRADTFEQIGHFGGACQAVAAQDSHVYFSEGVDLNIFNIANPDKPVGVNKLTFSDWVLGIHVSGTRAFIAASSAGLIVLDISNKSVIKILGQYDTPGQATDVTVNGDFAYIADGTRGLVIVNIKDPQAITKVGWMETLGKTNGVAYADGLAYVADGDGGLQIIDVTTPAAPRRRGGYGATDVRKVALSGKMACIADYAYGLRIIDVSNPDVTRQKGSRAFNKCYSVSVSDDKAYCANFDEGLAILDISAPETPSLRATFDTPKYAIDVAATDKLAFVADTTSLQILDIQNPAYPVKRNSHNVFSMPACDAQISGLSGCIAGIGDLQTVDLSNAVFPLLRGRQSISNEVPNTCLARQGTLVAMNNRNTVFMFDVQNPDQPKKISWLNAYDDCRVALFERLAVVGTYNSDGGRGKIAIYDLSNPAKPILVGTHISPHPVSGMAVNAHNVYVAQNQILTLDISDPSAPLRRNISNAGNFSDVASQGNIVYALSNFNSFSTISIFDYQHPSGPSLVSELKIKYTDNAYVRLKLVEDLLFAWHNNSMLVIDVKNPNNPHLEWTSPLSTNYYGVNFDDNRLYVCTSRGAYVFQRKREGLAVSEINRNHYYYDYAKAGKRVYADQPYRFTGVVPKWLDDQLYIQTRDIDKDKVGSSLLSFRLNQPAYVTVALDERITAPPSWLSGWTKDKVTRLSTTDPTSPGRVLYTKSFPAGKVTLGGNRDAAMASGRSMYSVFVSPYRNAVRHWDVYR